jgi:dihydropyrimidinase
MVAEDYFGSIIREGEGSSLIDFGIHCMLPPDLSFISQIPNIVRMGITSFKMMLGYHPLRGWTLDDFLLMKVLDLIGSSGGIAMFHCENGNAVGFLEDRLLAAGTYDPEHFLSSRPSLLESETLNRVSILCQLTNCPMYVVHLSSSEGLSALKEALQRGANITSETCPQYLLLSESDTIAQGARCKMAPPLRRPADNKALWQALSDGTINIAASDHAPWNLQNQKLSATDFASVPFGAPGVETLLPLLFSEGVSRGNLSLVRMVEILCLNPARKLGLYPKKGVIAKGSDADIAIIDPKKHWRVDESLLHSKAGYSAFHGWPMTGAPMTTVVKGKVVVEEGVLLEVPAYGRFLNRSPYKSGSSI